MAKKKLSPHKAKIMLEEGEVRGKKLSKKQRGFMGVVASGKTPKRIKKARKKGY